MCKDIMADLLDKKKLKEDLKQFSSSFDLDLRSMPKARVKTAIKKLEDDRENTAKSKDEDIQITNFLSYLYFLLDDQEHAIQLVDESLQNDPDNIKANANKAKILLENGEVSDVEGILSKLQEFEKRNNYDKRKCYAEANLAYAYSRSGPWYHQKAVELYEKVLETYPEEYAWQFGLGLTLLRRTHRIISQADDTFDLEKKKEKMVRVSEILFNVATKSDDYILSANAYATLGKAVYEIKKNYSYWNVPQKIKELDYKVCYEEAVSRCPEEPLVLNICGKLARYKGDIEASERYLRKSVEINPTCQGYHHLALTLKRKVEMGRGELNESHLNERPRYKNTVDNSQTYPTKQVRNPGSWSVSGKRQYRHQTRTYGDDRDRSQRNQHESRDRTLQMGRRPYSSDFHLNGTKDRSTDSHTSRDTLRRVIKSPLKVKVYPGNRLLAEAIELLGETRKLALFPLNIEYDKGIIYRMLGQTGKAVEVFKQIVSKRKYLPTQTLMTNVYEQLGLCLLELSESEETPPDMKQKHKKDAQSHLSHAVQLQSEIVANDPQFKEGWNSYPTLKELWSDKRDRKPKQLAVLHMRMGDHVDSINIYKKLSVKEKDKMEPQDYQNMLECYAERGQFEECVERLSSWECTTIFARLPESLIFEVYINGAFHAYSTDNAQLAYNRFRRAFKVYHMFDKTDYTEVDEDEDTKDILILHSCSQKWRCEFPRNLGTILEDCTGLRYTINTDDVLGNAITTESMVSMMKMIACIIIMTHDSAYNYDQLYVNHAVQMSSEKKGPGVLVVSDDKCNVPDIARTMPFIQMPPLLGGIMPSPLEGAVQQNDQIPDQLPEIQIEWVKEFTNLLKDQHSK
ncbi:uncharacterized protein LOC117337470 [Pecten maximus]|uniref:uncharacterized protein LOC117337470 n=1 Tax=Pecten maximus TaxID=6579 RepID=UPI001458402F|nr:uncharacterized protein LOC117337470 [Pecten maximus]